MKTELENAKMELIAWLNDECPSCFPPMEPCITADLSHDFAEKLRERLDNIIILKGELAALESDKQAINQPIGSTTDFVVNQPFFGNSGAEPQTSKTAEEIKHKINQIICRYHQDQDYKTPKATNDIFELFEEYRNQPQAEVREILIKFLEWFRIEVCTEDIPIEDDYFVDKFLNLNK